MSSTEVTDNDIATLGIPRERGKALVGDMGGFWRYRVGDYRVNRAIEDKERMILVVTIGHRRDVYD